VGDWKGNDDVGKGWFSWWWG